MNVPWNSLGSVVLGKTKLLTEREFKFFFKLNFFLTQYLWERLASYYKCNPIHLLWVLFYLKSRDPSEGSIASKLGKDRKVIKRNVILTLIKLKKVLPEV